MAVRLRWVSAILAWELQIGEHTEPSYTRQDFEYEPPALVAFVCAAQQADIALQGEASNPMGASDQTQGDDLLALVLQHGARHFAFGGQHRRVRTHSRFVLAQAQFVGEQAQFVLAHRSADCFGIGLDLGLHHQVVEFIHTRSPLAAAPIRGYNPLAGTPTVFPDGSVALNGVQEFQHRTGVHPARAQIEQAASAGGALSSAALAALNTGASGALLQKAASTQAQQAQAQQLASAEKAGAAQAKADEKAARAGQSRIDMKTGDLMEPASVSNLTGQQLTETYRAARKPETRRIFEQEMSRRDQQALQVELDAEQAGTVCGAERADAAFASVTEDAQADAPAYAPQLSAREQAGLASSLAGRELAAQPLSSEMAGLQAQLAEVKQRAADNGSWNVPLMGQRRRIEAAIAQLQAAEKPTTQGVPDGTQAAQAQQGSAQPSQVGAAPAVSRGAPDAQGHPGADGAQQAAAAGLTDGTPTANPGAQAAPAAGAQAATAAEPEFTTIKMVYGDSVTVRTADLNSDKPRLRQYTKDGKSKAVPADAPPYRQQHHDECRDRKQHRVERRDRQQHGHDRRGRKQHRQKWRSLTATRP